MELEQLPARPNSPNLLGNLYVRRRPLQHFRNQMDMDLYSCAGVDSQRDTGIDCLDTDQYRLHRLNCAKPKITMSASSLGADALSMVGLHVHTGGPVLLTIKTAQGIYVTLSSGCIRTAEGTKWRSSGATVRYRALATTG